MRLFVSASPLLQQELQDLQHDGMVQNRIRRKAKKAPHATKLGPTSFNSRVLIWENRTNFNSTWPNVHLNVIPETLVADADEGDDEADGDHSQADVEHDVGGGRGAVDTIVIVQLLNL